MAIPEEIFARVKQLIPPFTSESHKGQSGRVGVVGGASEFTGAPYYAAVSALRMGADISRVICSPSSAGAIKAYAPDLVVHPILGEDQSTIAIRSDLDSIFGRLDVIIIGPGLGREEHMQQFAKLALLVAKEQDMYIILDTDALWIIQRDPDIVAQYHKAVLVVDSFELNSLSERLGVSSDSSSYLVTNVSRKLGGITILQQGPKDIISFSHPKEAKTGVGEHLVEVATPSSLKHCDEGAILAGLTGTILAWAKDYKHHGEKDISSILMPLLASVGGSMVTRSACRRGFEEYGRGLVTQDVLQYISDAFVEVFGDQLGNGTDP